jgi:hypothetical protein
MMALGDPTETSRTVVVRILKQLLLHLKRRAFLPYIWYYDLRLFLSDVIAVKFRDEYRRLKSEHAGSLPVSRSPRRIAVVAIHPSDESIPFTINLLEALAEQDFCILVVHNRPMSRDQCSRILSRCHHLIERYPVGRDFGAYKRGLEWLHHHGKVASAETLILANDSMFYPGSFRSALSALLDHKSEWSCLFENFQMFHHAQSFFLLFRRSVFTSPAFTRFWSSYAPRSSRVHCIEKGEKGLSRSLKKAGFFPYALYSATRLVDRLSDAVQSGNNESNQLVDLLLDLYANEPAVQQASEKRVIRNAIFNAGSCMNSYNPTHRCGLIINQVTEAPVKRDLCYRDTCEMTYLLSHVRGFTETEKSLMAVDLRKKGYGTSISGLPKALYSWGRI